MPAHTVACMIQVETQDEEVLRLASQRQFGVFLKDIEPSSTTKSKAAKAHGGVRSYLKMHPEFGDVHIDTFLSGSYKRDTAVRPRRVNGVEERPDVDIIVITDHTRADDPAAVLGELYDALDEEYEDVERQRRSVGLKTANADMDVVPIIAPSGLKGTLYIPDRRLENWVETNPPGHTTWTTEVNTSAGGRFKPLVKLFKWWRRQNRTSSKKPKGFVVECIVAECMDRSESNYAELFVGTMEEIVRRYDWDVFMERVPEIRDPAVPGNIVTRGMTFASFKSFYEKAQRHAELGRQAIEEEDPDKELKLWRRIFGERFPSAKSAATKSADLLSDAAVPGASGLSFPDRPAGPRKPGGFA